MSEALDDSLPRLLLFDGRERSFAGAVGALAGLGMEVALLDGNESIEPSARDVIAVVVSEPRSDSDDLGRTERIVRHLREVHDVPVLILASTVDDDFLLQEFRPGARTHRARPVGLDCAERVRSILRTGESARLVFGALEIDRQRRVARVEDRLVDLTPKEFDLLEFLASSPRRAFSRDELLTSVWRSSGEWQSPATVTEHMRRLRRKIEAQPSRPRWLITVRRIGYRFEP
jgi:two-component system response regulator RegX3